MTLAEAKIGDTYIVTKINVEDITGRRLEALGLLEGTKIEVINKKRNGTSIFNVRGTRLAVGRAIALGISIEGGEK